MASSNTNVQLTGLDFNTIKSNFINYLQSQSTFKDYNFQGSAMSVLLDVLAYNTQYNAYYLNMVANEMFLDTALQRSSVISHAKLLDYTPKSNIAPTAIINITSNNVSATSVTLPQYTNFLSESVGGANYNFVTVSPITANASNNTIQFNNVEIKQGLPVTYTYTVDSVTNPTYTFELPDSSVDTTTIQVLVQQSSSNTSYTVYTQAQNYLILNGTSPVYWVQEGFNGNYQIYFGDGIIGNQLQDGNVIIVSYIVTQGTAAAGANSFVLMDTIQGLGTTTINGVVPASEGGTKESIQSIKFQAPKAYAAQNRAVSKDDYITLIQQNNLGYSFDAVNVWGGEENNPPVYGQVFVSLKPTGSLLLTDTQKQDIINNVISPISVMTVTPTIVDPDYTYLQIAANVVYSQSQTLLTANGIQQAVTSAVNTFTSSTLNTFNSTFSMADLMYAIQNADPSIITNQTNIRIQKKFYPNLTTPTTYSLNFGTQLQKGVLTSGITSTPSLQYRNPANTASIITSVFIEEVPSYTGGIQNINIVNPGYGYQSVPTVTILGDGSGATANATINGSGQITSITLGSSGNNYTQAVVVITPAANDKTGNLGAATAVLQGQYGTLRSYYYNSNNVKTILNNNIGTIDYINGIVTLNAFSPVQVNNPLGELTITATPLNTLLSSSQNRIVTVDPYDPVAITVTVTATK